MNFLNTIKRARESYLIAMIMILIVFMINFIAYNRFLRIDLTKNQLYAVAESSQNIMKNLNDIVTVKVFFSEKLPPNLYTIKQYVKDILDELGSYSNGNLNIEFLNPSIPNVQSEALALGIPQVQMNIIEKDKLEVKNGFLGISIQYGDKNEILPIVQNIANVEYDLVASIKKVTSNEERVVGFLIGHQEPSLNERIKVNGEAETLSLLKQNLDRNYKVKNINLNTENELKSIDTLLIVGSKTALSTTEKSAIEQFAKEGGNLVVMTDPFEITGDLQVNSNQFELEQLLLNYGVQIKSEFVLDRSNEEASFNQGFMSFVLPYPFWVKTIQEHFHETSPIVSSLESVVFPWVSPLKINQQQGAKVTTLISTTENAWANRSPFELEPNSIKTSQSKMQSPIAVYAETVDRDAGKLILVGNSRFTTDRFVKMYPQNLAFTMNAIDFLTLDSSLINIRSKNSFEMPLKELNINERNITKFIGIILMPILVILFGMLRFFSRRRTLNNIHWEKK